MKKPGDWKEKEINERASSFISAFVTILLSFFIASVLIFTILYLHDRVQPEESSQLWQNSEKDQHFAAWGWTM